MKNESNNNPQTEAMPYDAMLAPVTHKIVQWGEKKFEGTLEKCREVKKRWTEQHGNIDLDIVPIKFPTGKP